MVIEGLRLIGVKEEWEEDILWVLDGVLVSFRCCGERLPQNIGKVRGGVHSLFQIDLLRYNRLILVWNIIYRQQEDQSFKVCYN
jgi:hypothetical protein